MKCDNCDRKGICEHAKLADTTTTEIKQMTHSRNPYKRWVGGNYEGIPEGTMISFICRKCGTSVRIYAKTHRIAQCNGCKQRYGVNRDNTFTIVPLDRYMIESGTQPRRSTDASSQEVTQKCGL